MPAIRRRNICDSSRVPSLLVMAVLALCLCLSQAAQPASAAAGATRVVSLCPEATKLIIGLGEAGKLVGVSHVSQGLPGLPHHARILGWWAPDVDAVSALKPDLVILDPHQKKLAAELKGRVDRVIIFQAGSLAEVSGLISSVGLLVGAQPGPIKDLVDSFQQEAEVLKRKAALIGRARQRRVVVVLGIAPGGKGLLVAGPGSWSHRMLLAGGALPVPKNGGRLQAVTLQDWQGMNPQATAVCMDLRGSAGLILKSPGWKDVEAIGSGRIRHYPRRVLTTPSMRAAIAAQWLATGVYPDLMGSGATALEPDSIKDSRQVKLALPYVAEAVITHERLDDFRHASLLIKLQEPQRVLSTLEGQVESITTVGNHHLPPPSWNLGHSGGLPGLKARICRVLGLEPVKSGLLFTGVSMRNLVIQRAAEKGMEAYALVTAGVMSNAMRMGRDQGRYVEPGTINIIVLTNRRLSPRAMARALISITEAKSGALQDLDIRSAYAPVKSSATGTGTDNIIIVEGRGAKADLAGGHSKMGELIARAVRLGVTHAVANCNGITAGRSVITRLRERNLGPNAIYQRAVAKGLPDPDGLAAAMERRLLRPETSAAMARALAVADAQQHGLIPAAIGRERRKTAVPAKPLSWLTGGRALPPFLGAALWDLLVSPPEGRQ